MAGNHMSLLGDFFGLWRAWDGIRGLDYLLSRPEVDATRVGVTGNSGGGTLSSYLTALDARFTMAAPSCFVTTYLCNCENELPADSEQIPPGILAEGLDMADFFVAHLPRPTLLLGQNNDYFDRRGLEATYQELRRLYAIAGREQDVQLFVGPTNHGYSVENRHAMYRFFSAQAGVRGRTRETGQPEPIEALAASPKGQVHYMKPARVFDFTQGSAQGLAVRRKPLSQKQLCARIAKRLALPQRVGTPHYRVLRAQPLDTRWKRAVSRFAVETEPGIQALVHVVPRQGVLYHFPVAKRATLHVPHLAATHEAARGLAGASSPLFAVDVRGTGQVRARSCRHEDFFSPYGTDYFYTSQGHMLGEPYCGRRVHDLLCVLDLFRAKGYESVHLVGRGLGAITAAFAACVHPLVTRVTLHNSLASYHELTQVPVYSWPWSSMVPGVLRDFDLPDCYRLLKGKGLTLVRPWDSQMRVWQRGELRAHLEALGLQALRVRWED